MRRISAMFVTLALALAASPALAQQPEAEAAELEEADDQEASDEEGMDEGEEAMDEGETPEEADEDEAGEEPDMEVADDRGAEDLTAERDPNLADGGSPEPDAAGGEYPLGSMHPQLAVAPRIGVTAPQPFGDLGSWPVFGLDVGYILPFDVGSMERPVQLGLDVTYTRPGATGEGTHPMLGEDGADYEWELQQQMLTLQLTAMWRFMAPGEQLSAHAMIGPRAYFMESIMQASGNDGADFGENRETNSEYGVVFGGGVEYELGPGHLFGQLIVGGSPLDQRITGEANTGAFYLDAGYRLFF